MNWLIIYFLIYIVIGLLFARWLFDDTSSDYVDWTDYIVVIIFYPLLITISFIIMWFIR